MDAFPAAWYVVDGERGWIICEILTRMKIPEMDASIRHQHVYNPARLIEMIQTWSERKQALGQN